MFGPESTGPELKARNISKLEELKHLAPVTWQEPNDPRWDPELHCFLEIFFVSGVVSYS